MFLSDLGSKHKKKLRESSLHNIVYIKTALTLCSHLNFRTYLKEWIYRHYNNISNTLHIKSLKIMEI